jgi:formylglycine-generating enzyme required for sulfatase activity
MKKFIVLTGFTALMSGAALNAQVTIGQDKSPETFSVLELISNGTRGMRLPQLTTAQRQALVFTGHENEAMGLTIFNIFTRCVETWNGVEWIQKCDGEPFNPQTTDIAATSCEVSTDNSLTFTAKPDPAAIGYEFFLNNVSKGYQIGNSITFAETHTLSEITLKYYYPAAYLKPTMLPVKGNGGSGTWYYDTPVDGSTNGTATTVSIPDFKMSETPVTQAQYESVMGGNLSYFRCGNGIYDNYVSCRPTSALPVEGVSWYAAIAYCNKLSLIEGKTLCYSISGVDSLNLSGGGADGHGWRNIKYDDAVFTTTSTNADWNAATCDFAANGYRLPTEWEWEYAARGGTSAHPVFSGSAYTHTNSYYSDTQEAKDSLNLVGWSTNNNGTNGQCPNGSGLYYGTKEVKTKRGNVFGLYDMSGNVWEWCWNWFNDNSNLPFATPTDTRAYITKTDSRRVLHGGSWNADAEASCVSRRDFRDPWFRNSSVGFRVVCIP